MSNPINNPITDQAARDQALDPSQSFIIQAPAGSGKTELLIQRFLVLLGKVNKNPEEILAITFTRKAAEEMRERILFALKNAQENSEPPKSPHAKKTWQLAKKVLMRNQDKKWGLLENPSCLCITTIDSYCNKIISPDNPESTLSDYPEDLYQQAARDFLESLEQETLEQETKWAAELSELLLHLGNNYTKLENLFVTLLANRDQWLPYLIPHKSPNNINNLKNILENNIKKNIKLITKKIQENMPDSLFQEIITLLQFANKNLEQEISITQLLLTSTHTFRKSCNKTIGFPTQFPEMKKRMQVVLEKLTKELPNNGEILREYLKDYTYLPPSIYTQEQWKLISILLELLPLLVGHLLLVFRKQNTVDFIEIVAAASAALGEPDNPTTLALDLDYRIQHILLDEFQDTSISHYKILEKLVMGWQTKEDGRTLFLVGDPMQSIYRFRQAEVGLFLHARLYGIGDIRLTPLVLTTNFRSTPNIIQWLNQAFGKILPLTDDIHTGAVSYAPSNTPSSAVLDNNKQKSVELHTIANTENTATGERIVQIITQTWRTNPKAQIAVLVKSRNYLPLILPALKQAGLQYHAVDSEPLANASIIQDLFALTRALTHLADRTAWLAVLRAPYCGLTLADLYTLANHDSDPLTPLWASLEQFEHITLRQALSQDALKRLRRVVPILNIAIRERQRQPLVQWIKGTWWALGGPACAENRDDLEKTDAYFDLLQIINNNLINNFTHSFRYNFIDTLKNKLEKSYCPPSSFADSRLQIMTIHKAKGLEFDTVILPCLERKAPPDEHTLLLWAESLQERGQRQFILAPITSYTDEKMDLIYRYLYYQNNKKKYYETGRLLYVAATRAKQFLHLITTWPCTNTPPLPPKGSLLEQLWPVLKNDFINTLQKPEQSAINNPPKYILPEQTLRRLVAGWKLREK